jgi:hypothetical protein
LATAMTGWLETVKKGLEAYVEKIARSSIR